jgi:PKD repeat protein
MRWLGFGLVSAILALNGCGSKGGDEGRPSGGLEGSQGAVRYEASEQGEAGARAHFELGPTPEASASAASSAETEALDVRVFDREHAELTFRGVTLDGDGDLSEEERSTLRDLEATGLARELALIPLELGCNDDRPSPAILAALLFPWQLMQKYLVADREEQTVSFADAASCRYFTTLDGPADRRPGARYPLLTNGQLVARSFSYLPLDAEGALAPAALLKLETDQNVYGPGNSMCRGACGPDCEENNCGEPVEEWRCETVDGQNTGYKELWQSYTCGEHPGCVEHDACFDSCNDTHGFDSWDAAFCMRACDAQAASNYGAGQGLDWALGKGPFTNQKKYEYDAPGDPIYDEVSCPLDFTLAVVPASGIAPLATELRWNFPKGPGGPERCRLDLGDGSPVVDIDPCPENGKYAHIYGVPSEMRRSSGVYQATLTRVGSATSVTADVQANWAFEANPRSGPAPLTTGFAWLGFTLVDRPLTCTLDFGDGSAPEVLQDCRSKFATHEYKTNGVYTATLKVAGEDRPVTRSLVIEVQEPSEHRAIADVLTWEIQYDILTDSTHSWTEADGAIQRDRSMVETEKATLVLTRRNVSATQITLEGTGTATSSLEKTFEEQSQFFHNTRYDRGAGTTETQVRVTINPRTGYYDVYIETGYFPIQYGGTDTSASGYNHTYGPNDSTWNVAPAPKMATGELTRRLPSNNLNISGSYTWEENYAYVQSQDPTYDLAEVLKRHPKRGTTSFTMRPLTFKE